MSTPSAAFLTSYFSKSGYSDCKRKQYRTKKLSPPHVSFLEYKNCKKNYQGVDVLVMIKEVAFALFGSKKVATMWGAVEEVVHLGFDNVIFVFIVRLFTIDNVISVPQRNATQRLNLAARDLSSSSTSLTYSFSHLSHIIFVLILIFFSPSLSSWIFDT